MARRSRRENIPDPEDYIPDEDEMEEEEEERPRRKRRSRDEDDEDEAPRRRKRRSRDDDDDEEEDEKPRRKRRSRDDDDDDDEEEEERPRRKRRSRDDDDEDERPRARGKRRSRDEDDDEDDDDDDEDDRPRSRSSKSGGKKKKRTANRNAGWGGYDKVKSQTSGYADTVRIGKVEGELLIKFLDAEPFANYGLHWFDELDGKKGWPCLETLGEDDCPGCEVGDRPMQKGLFNILVFDNDGDPTLKVLDGGTRLLGQLAELSKGKGGLTGSYWSLTAGPKGSGTGNFQRIKERDLEEDYDIEPLDDDELDEWAEDSHVMEDVEQVPSYKDFRKVLREIED